MMKGPGLYSSIGKQATDLLYTGFQSDKKFTLSTLTDNGITITSAGTKKGDILVADVGTSVTMDNKTINIKVDTDFNILSTIMIDELVPGLKTIVNFVLPDQKSGKMELQYQQDYAGISASVGLNAKPFINFSGVIGTNVAAIGTDLSFNTASQKLDKVNAGLSYRGSDLVAAVTLNNMGNTLTASYFHTVSPLTCTAVGAELIHDFKTNDNCITIGTQHALDPLTLVKAQVNSFGKASALLQHEWRPKSLFTISGEVDTRAIEKSAKVGLALALKP